MNMKLRKFSAHHTASSKREEKPDPYAIIEALKIMEQKIENLSERVQHLLDLVASLG